MFFSYEASLAAFIIAMHLRIVRRLTMNHALIRFHVPRLTYAGGQVWRGICRSSASPHPYTHIATRSRFIIYSIMEWINNVRLGMGAYNGAARRRVHLVTVLFQPPPGHRPVKRQARHARILQIGLHLTQSRSERAAARHMV